MEETSLRNRQWDEDDVSEATLSGAVPSVIGSFSIRKKVFPNEISGVVDILRKKKKRLIRKSSKFSPPLPPRI